MGGFPEEGYSMLEVMAQSTIDILDKLDLDYYNSVFSSADFDDDDADGLEAFIEQESAKALATVIEDGKITWLGVNNCIYNETTPEEIVPVIIALLAKEHNYVNGKLGEVEENKRIDYFSLVQEMLLGEKKKYRLDLDFHKNKLIGFALYKPISE